MNNVNQEPPVSTARQSRPRILIVITKADVGGAQMHVLQIIRELREQFEFVLATGAEDFLTREVLALNAEVVLLPQLVRPISPLTDLRAWAAIYRLIRRERPALVHAHSFKAGLVARLAALAARTPSLFTAHGWAFTPGAPTGQRIIGFALESVLCRLCRGVVTISRHDYDLARRWHVGPENSRYLVRNAADEARQRARPGKEPVRLLTIGRLSPVKNQGFLLEVLSRLPEEIHLEIVGEGAERDALQRKVADLGVTSRVQFSGEVTDIGDALSRASIYVLGSHFEGLPLSILEAMAAGLPVVSTDVGGVSEAVVDGETGFLATAGEVEVFVSRVLQLAGDGALRENMGTRAMARFQEHFKVDRFLKEMKQVYTDHVGSTRPDG